MGAEHMKLSDVCIGIAEAATEAQGWLDHPVNAELVGNEKSVIRREMRRGALRARKLARAADRRMAISVFGPSQAGKSFLVSVLARPKDGSLVSDFPDPGGKLDFISEINPEGEGESTGIVTRFTTHAYQAPDGFPVKLSLLSESDIARILVNSFMMDGDQSEEESTSDEIDDLLKRLGTRAGAPVAGVSSDDVIETQEYLQKNFGKATYVAALSEFWERAIELAPTLSVSDRGQLFSILWGRHQSFTDLYVRAAEALQSIGGGETAFVGLDALIPREDSIIDVKLLLGLDQTSGASLQVASPDGRAVSISKALVTALTAEMVMPMSGELPEVFQETDLLDFPGARTRDPTRLADFLKKGVDSLKECILRGKVAYLFDRYVAAQEITAMLLCVPDGNVETSGLAQLIEDWVVNTHGETPATRDAVETLLFFVLTKFDKHLVDSAGSSEDASTRFQRRMESSFTKFARMPDSWPNHWNTAGAFKNCFWLRNPNFPAEAVIDYEGGREIGLRAAKTDRLTELRSGCCSAALVETHFRSPEAAWDAAMSLNDGGVSYLIENLVPVCRPEMKQRQISTQLDEVAGKLSRALNRFYVSDDYTVRLEERRAAAQALNMELLNAYNHGRFPALLQELTVSTHRMLDKLRRPPGNIRFVSGNGPATPASAGGPILPGGVVMPGAGPQGVVLPGAPVPPSPMPGDNSDAKDDDAPKSMTRSAWQAEAAFSHWVETVRNLADSENLHAEFAISPASAGEMVSELIASARRLDLEGRICRDLEGRATIERTEKAAIASAIIAVEHLNAFVTQAGAGMVDADQRPDVQLGDGSKRKPFVEQRQADGILDLPAHPEGAIGNYFTDWVHMVHWSFEENAKETDGGRVNPEENARLGDILKRFETA